MLEGIGVGRDKHSCTPVSKRHLLSVFGGWATLRAKIVSISNVFYSPESLHQHYFSYGDSEAVLELEGASVALTLGGKFKEVPKS